MASDEHYHLVIVDSSGWYRNLDQIRSFETKPMMEAARWGFEQACSRRREIYLWPDQKQTLPDDIQEDVNNQLKE
jgi:hypothetical protein